MITDIKRHVLRWRPLEWIRDDLENMGVPRSGAWTPTLLRERMNREPEEHAYIVGLEQELQDTISYINVMTSYNESLQGNALTKAHSQAEILQIAEYCVFLMTNQRA
ncbi:hypothetical protein VII00023_08719 [Vibrio ichthyoenteri ATCC 700023]|uniref:Uncharacterized protein n=1 Tax=Vibrio ichthyoenteri ATCC 700023 TaxID=870968 RepID=F9S5P5_9VIBR|nr:hypothetical protein [Vibrio ichthyoenteri]EGU35574.1 hypothetical protein VII00023_08719 [Vibrio ichthyoenteri ATCC 700023]